MQTNFEWFRTFKAIYETETMSGAAKQLFVSQPGVGLHLNALEAYTGYPLFERTGRKMIPTERGHLLYEQLQNSLETLEDIESRFRKKSGKDRPTVSVGMCVESFQQNLEKYIPEIDFNLIMQFGENEKLIEWLENGTLDFILTTRPQFNTNTVYEPFTQEQMVLVAGRDTDLTEWNTLNLSNKDDVMHWLTGQLWYNTATDVNHLKQFWEANFNTRPDFVPNFIVPNKFSIIRCLSLGKGLAVIPDFLCKEAVQNGDIRIIWEGYKPVVNVMHFGKRKNPVAAKQIIWLEERLRSEFKEQATSFPHTLAVG
ncbi:LysR family transcriptional regulator [Rhizosphaericola mali]|uniref:LysR family transcriptional regulator n=1 Tax=Rhizosphaericola mali TaxID=2545455 RepID=A0A5P2FXE9_9BACT|nr:LysR family transcriptional regulator [Rhizosphaericola mali]QES88196.1 LysR family transcriptional regulator [Rhizosphaericola mali]